jgi:hypothetical protein
LLLDGHGSRWSVPALRKLISNNVFPFIFASHTSIWAQLNDAGVNKRFHWAIEKSAKQMRRGEEQATLEYFNPGVFPLDPFASAWTEAIETLLKIDSVCLVFLLTCYDNIKQCRIVDEDNKDYR